MESGKKLKSDENLKNPQVRNRVLVLLAHAVYTYSSTGLSFSLVFSYKR